ncbi:MAG: hypothetical protein K9L62_15765 [Vallitaleaceae bacterium]|nr:hypothetical protein [Vallitaleaceae bacterium]
MTETKLLDNTLGRIDETGTGKAYEYLKAHLNKDEDWSSQVYNFLYCLAATSDLPDEALTWLEEAIIEKGQWYRPDVFEDEDLDSIRNEERFHLCEKTSKKRYEDALKEASTEFTLKERLEDNLLVVLHGNQQNNDISRGFWRDISIEDYQVEYLQSKELDSYNLYRWNDDGDGPKQLASAMKKTDDLGFDNKVLAGFSAGCNTILRAIVEEKIVPDKLLLFSPWIPVIEGSMTQIIESLKESAVEVMIVCGELDEDCLPLCKLFEEKANELDYECTIRYIQGLGHEYPEDLSTYTGAYL